jgi:hypothetical protein
LIINVFTSSPQWPWSSPDRSLLRLRLLVQDDAIVAVAAVIVVHGQVVAFVHFHVVVSVMIAKGPVVVHVLSSSSPGRSGFIGRGIVTADGDFLLLLLLLQAPRQTNSDRRSLMLAFSI